MMLSYVRNRKTQVAEKDMKGFDSFPLPRQVK